MDYGFGAMWSVLKSYYYRHGLYTIKEIIGRWAPASDNNPTAAYVAFVAEYSDRGSREHLKFNYEGMSSVMMAMARYESGYFKEDWEASCRRGFYLIFRRQSS